MLFNSLEFLLFFPIVFALYWSLKEKVRIQNILLLLASYFFYGWWDYRFLSLIVLSSLIDFLLGKKIASTDQQSSKKKYLYLSLLVNLGALGVFKYYNFFSSELNNLLGDFGYELSWTTLNIVLPVGISFYTFQTLSYTIDVYRGNIKATNNIIQFFAFVSFFPQLVAGPIERASNLLPQFSKKREFTFERAKDGTRQIVWGFFKKVAIADVCAPFVDAGFSNPESTSSIILILSAFLFSLQIYGDFSGYSDIAIGTARLLGFDLMKNFSMPYFSRDIPEFWRKWHISLSTWFRDYLYIPLGGSRGGTGMRVRNTFAIFLVSGFWHGANWTFMFWGFLHALLFLPKLLMQKNRTYLTYVAEGKSIPSLREFMQMLLTFVLVTFAWIFFRADSISAAFDFIYYSVTFSSKELLPKAFKGITNNIHLVLLFVNITFLILIEWKNRMKEHGFSENIIFKHFIYLYLFHEIVRNFFSDVSFIYFQF